MWAKKTSSYQSVSKEDETPAVSTEPIKNSFLFRRASGPDVYNGKTKSNNVNTNSHAPDSTRL